ncbi:putative uDENN domain protein [Tanacetum coccineum]
MTKTKRTLLVNEKDGVPSNETQKYDTTKYHDPTSLFEHFLIAGIHPNANLGPMEDAFAKRKKWEAKSDKTDLMDLKVMQFRSPPSVMVEPQVADNATLYGVCLHTQEFVQRPPGMIRDASPLPRAPRKGSHFLVTAPRCYCLLTRVPFFELHYQMLNRLVIVAQERLNRITQFVSEFNLDHIPSSPKVYNQEDDCSLSIIEDVLTSPSKLRINSPYNRNGYASDKRWEYLGKVHDDDFGVLSATVLSLIPMILPFEWQSLFLPVLPGKMFEFLDAPVPFVVGILHKPSDNKMKMSNNLVHVNLDDNQVEMSSLPALPKQRELMTRLGPLHARLSSDKTSAKKHPVYRCNKWQIDVATQFLAVVR